MSREGCPGLPSQEVCSGPQLATRIMLSFCYKLASATGYNAIYDWPSAWRGWYSLEIGVEITTAITLGFLVWLLFALVYDAAGILVGLVPSSVTSIVILTFRFHIRSYILLGIIPIVVSPPHHEDVRVPHSQDAEWGFSTYWLA